MINGDEAEAQKKAKQVILLEKKREQLAAQLNDCYLQLGREIYEITESKAKEMNVLLDELVETKIKLSQLEDLRLCFTCMTQHPANHHYCSNCGQKLLEE